MQSHLIVIPARMKSQRLKRKMLLNIHGHPMLYWTVSRIKKMDFCDYIVATDSAEILNFCEKHNFKCLMSSPECVNGTERVYEISKKIESETYINVQGDEPLISKENVKRIIETKFQDNAFSVALTEYKHFENDISDVKALVAKDAIIELSREDPKILMAKKLHPDISEIGRVIGLYSYKKSFLEEFFSIKPGPRELSENIEQLRCIENNMKINGLFVGNATKSVDTFHDLEKMRKIPKINFEII